jgi:hypothetical protein
MTKSSHWLLGASALASFAALSACSGKGAPGGGQSLGGGSINACVSQAVTQTVGNACFACMENACASQLGAFGSDCSDYLQCLCPNGAFDNSAESSQSCEAKITSDSACLPSAQAVNGCAGQSCASACQAPNPSSGSSSGGGSSVLGGSGGGSGGGGSGGSGGVSGMTACGVEFSSATCAQCVAAQCCSATQTCGQDQACVMVIQCIHQCGQDSSCEDNCVSGASASAQQELNAAATCWSSSCSSGC